MRISSKSCRPAPCALIALVVMALLVFAGDASPRENPVASSPPEGGARWGLEPGMNAPGFVLKDIDGGSFDLQAERAKSPVLLLFFSMFCEPCRRGLADAQKLQKRFGGARLRVAAVALDGEPLRETVLGFARQEGYGFRVLVDKTDDQERFMAASLFRVTEIPTIFLVDNSGRIVLAKKGAIPEEEIEKFLSSVGKQ